MVYWKTSGQSLEIHVCRQCWPPPHSIPFIVSQQLPSECLWIQALWSACITMYYYAALTIKLLRFDMEGMEGGRGWLSWFFLSCLAATTFLRSGNKQREGNVRDSQQPTRFFTHFWVQFAFMKKISHSFHENLFGELLFDPHNGPGGMGKGCAGDCVCVLPELCMEILPPRWQCSQDEMNRSYWHSSYDYN